MSQSAPAQQGRNSREKIGAKAVAEAEVQPQAEAMQLLPRTTNCLTRIRPQRVSFTRRLRAWHPNAPHDVTVATSETCERSPLP